jgi:hypothetical protein
MEKAMHGVAPFQECIRQQETVVIKKGDHLRDVAVTERTAAGGIREGPLNVSRIAFAIQE